MQWIDYFSIANALRAVTPRPRADMLIPDWHAYNAIHALADAIERVGNDLLEDDE